MSAEKTHAPNKTDAVNKNASILMMSFSENSF